MDAPSEEEVLLTEKNEKLSGHAASDTEQEDFAGGYDFIQIAKQGNSMPCDQWQNIRPVVS